MAVVKLGYILRYGGVGVGGGIGWVLRSGRMRPAATLTHLTTTRSAVEHVLLHCEKKPKSCLQINAYSLSRFSFVFVLFILFLLGVCLLTTKLNYSSCAVFGNVFRLIYMYI